MGKKHSKNNKRKHKSNTLRNHTTSEPYRFGTGIDLIDFNILPGPEVEMAVNRIIPEPDDKNDENNIV